MAPSQSTSRYADRKLPLNDSCKHAAEYIPFTSGEYFNFEYLSKSFQRFSKMTPNVLKLKVIYKYSCLRDAPISYMGKTKDIFV